MLDSGQLVADHYTTWEMEFLAAQFRYSHSSQILPCKHQTRIFIVLNTLCAGLSWIMDCHLHAAGQRRNVERKISQLGATVLGTTVLSSCIYRFQFFEGRESDSQECSSLWPGINWQIWDCSWNRTTMGAHRIMTTATKNARTTTTLSAGDIFVSWFSSTWFLFLWMV